MGGGGEGGSWGEKGPHAHIGLLPSAGGEGGGDPHMGSHTITVTDWADEVGVRKRERVGTKKKKRLCWSHSDGTLSQKDRQEQKHGPPVTRTIYEYVLGGVTTVTATSGRQAGYRQKKQQEARVGRFTALALFFPPLPTIPLRNPFRER